MPMLMRMIVLVRMGMSVAMAMGVSLGLMIRSVVVSVLGQVDFEPGAGDTGFMGVGRVQMIIVEAQLAEFAFEPVEIDAHIDQGADEHIAADTAEEIKIKSIHLVLREGGRAGAGGASAGCASATRALIWLAA